jgi:hypothetical protein
MKESEMRIPRATRVIKDEFVVIGKLIEDDSYLDWTIQQFRKKAMNASKGKFNPKRVDEIYYLLMNDAGLKVKTDWKCPINYEGCVENCGSYSCGN